MKYYSSGNGDLFHGNWKYNDDIELMESDCISPVIWMLVAIAVEILLLIF